MTYSLNRTPTELWIADPSFSMDLPDLPPDLDFLKLGKSHGDIDFAFEAKRAAMGPYIVTRWGWDEAFQRDLHQRRFDEKPFFEIRRPGQRLGTVSFQVMSDHVRFGEFYLFPAFQRRGIGSAVLGHCLAIADHLNLQ